MPRSRFLGAESALAVALALGAALAGLLAAYLQWLRHQDSAPD